jgi:ketosteroid isomerase-like protein
VAYAKRPLQSCGSISGMPVPQLAPAEALRAINRSWVIGRLEDLERLLHPRAVIVGADLTPLAEGREACLGSYRDFLDAATVRSFEEHDVRVEQYGDTSIVSYCYHIDYDIVGRRHEQKGREVLVLVASDQGWQAVWRQVLPPPAVATS